MEDLGKSIHLLPEGSGGRDQDLGLTGIHCDGLSIVRKEGEQGRRVGT